MWPFRKKEKYNIYEDCDRVRQQAKLIVENFKKDEYLKNQEEKRINNLYKSIWG